MLPYSLILLVLSGCGISVPHELTGNSGAQIKKKNPGISAQILFVAGIRLAPNLLPT
jgi:hypothetical protein